MIPHLRLHYAPDNASLIVRLALEELRQPYETVLVERAANGLRTPAYLALNPHGLIPTLETPNGPIFETAAILLWLADTHAVLAPLPDGPARGNFLKWLFFISNTIHPAMRMIFHPAKYVGPDPANQNALCHTMQGALKTHFKALDNRAAEQPPFFNSIPISILDLYTVVLLRWMALYPQGNANQFNLDETPHLAALAARIEQREAVKRAIQAEELGATPFTNPDPDMPPEGNTT